MSNLSKNTWTLNEWYQQAEAGNVDYQGANAGFYWGFPAGGQNMGPVPGASRSSPTQINCPSPGGWKNVNTYDYNTSAIGVKNDHTLWTWGNGDNGKLGRYVTNEYGENPGNANRSSPIQLPGNNWDRGLSGESGTFLRTRDGNLFYCGNKAGGITGQNNDNIRYSSPIQIPGTWSEAWDYSNDGPILAVKTNGTLWTWGRNYRGAQAQNVSVPENTGAHSSPTQIGFNDNWATHEGAVASTPGGGAAITKEGELFVWGRNEAGRCGPIGPNEGYSSPVQVPIGTTYEPWHTVVSSNYSVMAIRKDGSMWGWGTPFRGALGIDSLAPSPDDQAFTSPMRIGPSTEYDWAVIAPLFSRNSARHALKGDGSLWAWGQNEFGQTGLNEVSEWGRSSPTQVGTSTNWNPKNPPRGNRVKLSTKEDPGGG